MRVLLIPNFSWWITGTEAKQIASHLPDSWDCTVLSLEAVKFLHRLRPDLHRHFDVVHLFTPWVAIVAGPWFRGHCAIVTTLHHVLDEKDLEADLSGDALMTVCEMWEQEALRRGFPSDRIVRVPNGVDPAVFRAVDEDERMLIRQRLGASPQDFLIGYCCGRQSNQADRKGIDIYLDGIHRVLCDMPNCVPVIVGPGWAEEVKSLRRHANRVIYRPFVHNHKEVADIYRALDCFWVTARVEGGPVPLLEAMACACCALATPVGVVPEVLSHGKNGFIVEDFSSKTFAELTVKLVKDPDLRRKIGREAARTILLTLTWRLTTRQCPELYGAAYRHHQLQTGKCSSKEALTPADRQQIQRIGNSIDAVALFDQLVDLNGVGDGLRNLMKILSSQKVSPTIVAAGVARGMWKNLSQRYSSFRDR